jgi:hypothetical protein
MTTRNPRDEVRCKRCGFRALLPAGASESLATAWDDLDVLDTGDGIDLHREVMLHSGDLERAPWRPSTS